MLKATMLLNAGVVLSVSAVVAMAQTPVTGRVINIDPPRSTFTIQEPAPTNRVTVYSVNSSFRATINGVPMTSAKDMHLGDICSVTVVTPPFAATAACKR